MGKLMLKINPRSRTPLASFQEPLWDFLQHMQFYVKNYERKKVLCWMLDSGEDNQ